MEPLTAAQLNNYIVSMRHNVKKARTHIVHKLTRQKDKLLKKSGTEEEKAKNLAKADKLVQNILALKKLDPDVVSKFCLSTTQNPMAILADDSSELSLKAMARLSTHDSLVGKIVKFRQQYPDWKESVPRILALKMSKGEMSVKAYRKEKMKLKTQMEAKVQKAIGASLKEMLKEEKSKKVETQVVKGNTFIVETIEDFPSANVLDALKSQPFSKPKKRKEALPDRVVESKHVKVTKEALKSPQVSPEKPKAEKVITPKKEKRTNPVGVSSSEVEAEKIAKQADPFFMTKDNKEYLSASAANATEEKEIPTFRSDFRPKDGSRESFGSRGSDRSRSFSFKDRDRPRQSFKENPGRNFKSFNGFNKEKGFGNKEKFNKSERPPSSFGGKRMDEPTKLHPSWEAKKKISTLQEFQGKKIVFDD